MSRFKAFLQKRKYEVLLVALILHLFIGAVLHDLGSYTHIIWPINMLILGIASIGVFSRQQKWKRGLRNILFALVLAFPLSIPFLNHLPMFMSLLSAAYVIFFAFIFYEIIRFLVKPGYINADIISASACGYFLLLEISTFLMQMIFYSNRHSFHGINTSSTATIFIDFVYFCSVTISSIGFGDIFPTSHSTKLITSLFGIAGQLYSVVLVGMIISKFTSKQDREEQQETEPGNNEKAKDQRP